MNQLAEKGNIKKLNNNMSKEQDSPFRPGGAKFRYVLLSTPRCGSNLVGDMLQATGAAGNPMEYLNSRYLLAWDRMRPGQEVMNNKQFSAANYLRMLEGYRTTENGAFGIKVHYSHLQAIWKGRKQKAARIFSRFDRFILLRRRDKISQSVSLYKAYITQIWSSRDYEFLTEDDPRRSKKVNYSATEISGILKQLLADEEGWRNFLDKYNFPYIEVCYEDFVEDYLGQSRRLLDYLKLEVDTMPQAPRISRQGKDNDPLISAFRSDIGLDY